MEEEKKEHMEEEHKPSNEREEHPKEEEHEEEVVKQETKESEHTEPETKSEEHKPKKSFNLKNIYDKQYKKLLIIPFSLLAFAIIYLIIFTATTGDFINRDVSLKGGTTITIPLEKDVGLLLLEEQLSNQFNENDVSVRSMRKGGSNIGVVIEADIDGTNAEELDSFLSSIGSNLNADLEEIDYSVEIIGSSLGTSFFKEAVIALLIAFVFMGLVVFLYFRTFVPSLAVILAALSDIIVTLAIVDLIGLKLSTAGLAAFLMLIGYSVDTDILLSTKLLKRKEGTIFERTLGALKTGLTMTGTTIAAISVALIFAQSSIIKQIMLILLIGLFVDLINTWIQNVGILRLYLDKKTKNE